MKCMRLCGLAAFFLLVCPVFAPALGFGDALVGKKDVSVVKTKWFDVIFPAESAPAAAILAQNADALYEKAAALLETEPQFRMPLVITRSSDALNAYYSPYPSRRLLVYDTVPDYSLSVQRDSLLSTVYHEILHAVSLNLKHPAVRAVSDIFGDVFSPVFFDVPWSFIEGVTVGNESLDGDGRLDDDYSLHTVRQAKIEGKFPAWSDATGFRDAFPGGSIPYLFGGAFSAWLEKTWGMEKYVAFWRGANNFQTLQMNFYNIYGVKIADAWKRFEASVETPDIPARPEDSPDVRVTRITGKSGVFGSVSYSEAGVAWLESSSGDVFFLPAGADTDGAATGRQAAAKKIASKLNASRVSLSAEGDYAAISWNTGGTHNLNRVSVYSRTRKALVDCGASSIRDASVVRVGGAPFLCAVKTDGQEASLVYYALGKEALKKGAESWRVSFPRTTVPFSPVDAGDGRTAFVRKAQGSWGIALLDPRTKALTLYEAPLPGMTLRSLNAKRAGDALTLYFSWTEGGSLPRPGTLEITPGGGAEWRLFRAGLSGGVYGNAPFVSASGEVLFYAARLYEEGPIYQMEAPDARAEFMRVIAAAAVEEAFPALPASPLFPPSALISAYNPFRYWTDGVFLPASLVTVYNEDLTALPGLGAGATWITGDPGELAVVTASAGYDIVSRAGGLSLGIIGGREIFSGDVSASALFSETGFSQSVVSGNLSSTISLGGNAALVFADSAFWFCGRVNSLPEQWAERFWNTGAPLPDASLEGGYTHRVQNTFSAAFSTVRSRGPGYYESGGFTVQPFLLTDFSQSSGSVYVNPGLALYLRLPRLLPFNNPLRVTVNLPAAFTLWAFPARNRFLEGRVEIAPFSWEIQRGGNLLFCRRVSITAAYDGYFRYSGESADILRVASLVRDIPAMPYRDSVTLSAFVTTGVNSGVLTSVPIELGGDFIFHPNRDPEDAPFQAGLHLKVQM